MSMSFAIPSLAERRASRVAALAYYAYWVSLANQGGHDILPMCKTCGLGTGNWCDKCENQGHTFEWRSRTRVGQAYCTICERDATVVCRVCGM